VIKGESGFRHPQAGRQPFALVPIVVTAAVSSGAALGNAADLHLTKGQRRVFATGSLQVGAQLSCSSGGIRIAAEVAARGHAVATVADGPHGSATIALKTLADGRVIASCK
jgi:hypothetical protein